MDGWHYTTIHSPIGPLLVAGDETGLRLVSFQAGRHPRRPEDTWTSSSRGLEAVLEQLHAYFEGELTTFELRLAPVGTPFQLEVWTALRAIPYGETISYGELARRIGRPDAARAVGLANGANPLPIIVPCHRVIGADGSLTGFGGGLAIKQQLLRLEQRQGALF